MKNKEIGYDGHNQYSINKRDFNATDVRIGHFYRKLGDYQKRRFNRIVNSLAYKLNLALNQCPIEMILMRQIALMTVKIDEAELQIINNPEEKYASDAEAWILRAQKERRGALELLSRMGKSKEKRKSVTSYDDLRNILRDKEDLPATVTEIKKDGHQRRAHNDGVSRTEG